MKTSTGTTRSTWGLYLFAAVAVVTALMLWMGRTSAPNSITDTSRSDTGPYASLAAMLFPINEKYGWPNELQSKYPEQYEPEIVLHLPMRIATQKEYRAASDTEKAGHWWIDSNGMTLEGAPIDGGVTYGYRPTDLVKWGGDTPYQPFNRKIPILTTDRSYSFYPYFGVDSDRYIYIMPENEIGIRVYSPDGAYLRTLHKRDTGYAAARAIVSRSWFGQCREFRPEAFMVGYSEKRRRAISNLSEIGGPSDTVILRGGLQAQYARDVSGIGGESFLDAMDEEHNIYGAFFLSEELSQKSRNPLTRLADWKHFILQRTFLTKYDRQGRLLAEIELLPCYQGWTLWGMAPEQGHRYVKIVSAREFYFLGITYLDDSFDIYVIRYRRPTQ